MPVPLATADLIGTALRKFEGQTGLPFRIKQGHPVRNRKAQGDTPDAWVELPVGPAQLTLAAKVVTTIDRAWKLDFALQDIKERPDPGILVTHHLTRALADHCKEMGLQFLDTAGNAYINQPGLFILITGQRPDLDPPREARGFRGFGPTGLRILFAITCAPELLNAPYRDIAKAAGVGLATVAEIFAELKKEGFLLTAEDGKRRLLNLTRLRDNWTGTFPYKLRGKLQAMRFTAPAPDWWKEARPAEDGAYWGGEVAAAKLTGHLLPKTCTIYAPDPKGLILRHRLRPDPQGAIEILRTFWGPTLPQAPHPFEDVVHPMLVEADLKAIDDPRTLETARMIHDRFLA